MEDSIALKALPNFSLCQYSNERLKAILSFRSAAEKMNSINPRRAFQAVPRSLRRRAASHNPKRIPRRYRSFLPTCEQSKKGSKNRKKFAKFKDGWLPCHLWYAKRFEMGKVGNFFVPIKSREKSFRKSYFAAKERAIAFDLSFYNTYIVEESIFSQKYVLKKNDDFNASCFIIEKATRKIVSYAFVLPLLDENSLLIAQPPATWNNPLHKLDTIKQSFWLIHGPKREKVIEKLKGLELKIQLIEDQQSILLYSNYEAYREIHGALAKLRGHDLRLSSLQDFEQFSFERRYAYPTVNFLDFLCKFEYSCCSEPRISESIFTADMSKVHIVYRYSLTDGRKLLLSLYF